MTALLDYFGYIEFKDIIQYYYIIIHCYNSVFSQKYFLAHIFLQNINFQKEAIEKQIEEITKKENESDIKKAFSTLEGNIIVSKISNKKAEVHEV